MEGFGGIVGVGFGGKKANQGFVKAPAGNMNKK